MNMFKLIIQMISHDVMQNLNSALCARDVGLFSFVPSGAIAMAMCLLVLVVVKKPNQRTFTHH